MAFGFFDGQKADASPESIKRKRAMIAQLLSGGRAPRNIGEGFSSIGDSVAAAILGARADAEEKAGNASSAEAMRNIYSGFGAPMAAVGGAPVATGSATGSGATRAPQSFTGTQAEFVAKIMPYAVQEGQRTGVDPSIIVAQAALESGWGRSAPGNNFFGIKSHGRPGGQTFATTEVINGQTKRINDSFRTFASMGDSVRGYGDFLLQNPRYRPMLEARGLDAQIAALGRSGYATDPNYASKIRSIASGIRMPVVNPGPGAAPMPLARQQAQTAPMPNVASVQGDNPQQLLADAAYYEKNGNPEAARQMRERAQLATARPVQTASAGPKSNEGQMQDGAGELQAGGSEMMGLAGVGVNPAAPPDMAQIAGAQGFADNEEQTRAMEAQMAAEQGLPYAGNEPGLLSPIPMGFGRNPFLPYEPDAMAQAPAAPAPSMNRATFDQVTAGLDPRAPAFTGQGVAPSWGIGDPDAPAPDAQEVSVRPARDTVPLPAANIQPPQSPAMRAPLPVDMGGENSGGSAMQFIESEFARREGRPDPRMAVGAPQGYNPFVPQALQAPQMAGDGGSVQGASQAGAMAGGAAQAPAQVNSRIAELASIAGNPMVRPEVRQLAMAEIQAERARAQAEAERARTQQANEAAARAAGIDPALLGNPVIGKAATEAKFREAPETFRDLTPAERTQRGIDPNDRRPYQISTKTGKLSGVGGAQTNVNVNNASETEFDKKLGGQQAEMFGQMLSSGTQIQSDIADISQLRELVKTAPTGLQGAAVRFAGNLGISLGEGASDVQAFEAIVNRLVPAQRPPGSGTMSDRDVDLFKSSLPRLINQPGGNNRILDTMEGMTRYRQAQFEIARDVAAGQLSRRDALDRLSKLDNPLAWVRQQNRTSAGTGQTGNAPASPPPAQGGFRILKVE